MLLHRSRTVSVSIERSPRQVYEFVGNPENLPTWAAGLARSVRKSATGWVVETPDGQFGIEFVPQNELGVLDHCVTPPAGSAILNPMRVVANGSGSEVLFTLFQLPGVSEEQFSEDAEQVERDLKTLKTVLERALS